MANRGESKLEKCQTRGSGSAGHQSGLQEITVSGKGYTTTAGLELLKI